MSNFLEYFRVYQKFTGTHVRTKYAWSPLTCPLSIFKKFSVQCISLINFRENWTFCICNFELYRGLIKETRPISFLVLDVPSLISNFIARGIGYFYIDGANFTTSISIFPRFINFCNGRINGDARQDRVICWNSDKDLTS